MKEKKLLVREMQGYIESHIQEVITLKQLSDACFISPSYASKIFKEVTETSPYQYIKARRLSKAAVTLRDDEKKVLDVALDYVFDSHEGFTRAFSKQFGVTPKRYSKKKMPIQYFLPTSVVIEKKETEMRGFIFTQVIERPKRKVIIKRGETATEYFKYCDEVGCDVWGLLVSVKEALYEPAGFWLPEYLIKPGTSQYVHGVEVPLDFNNEVPEGFDLIELPACQYMIFQGQPYDDDAYQQAVGECMKAIETFDPKIYGYAYDYTQVPKFQLAPSGAIGYIEGHPIKKI